MNIYLVKSYLSYLLKSKYKKGYGLHSPFVFDLVRDLIGDSHRYYIFESIKAYRKQLMNSKQVIAMTDYGAGSTEFNKKERRVSELVLKSSIHPRYGELLFRLANHFKPNCILELGTSIGISTSYLSRHNSSSKVYTVEGCENTAAFASKTFKSLKCRNVNQIVGQFKDVLPELVASLDQLDMVFIDGHHERQATIDYFNICLSKAGNDSLFIFDDIHWSKGMYEAWKIICDHPKVTVSLDLFQIGIIFFRKECQKQHFVVSY